MINSLLLALNIHLSYLSGISNHKVKITST